MAIKSVAERDEFTLVECLVTPEYLLDVKFSDMNIEPESFARIGARLASASSDLLSASMEVGIGNGVRDLEDMSYGIEFLMRVSSMFSRLSIEATTQRKRTLP